MGNTLSQREIGLFPEGAHEGWPCPFPAELTARLGPKLAQVPRTEVRQAMVLQVAPQGLHGIKFRRVSRQLGEMHFPGMALQQELHLLDSVHGQPIPDDQHWAADLAAELTEELGCLRSPDRALVETEVEVPSGDPCDHTDMVPAEAELKLRCLAKWGPSAYHRGPVAQAGFVDEDDGSAFCFCPFPKAGQVWRFHRAMAALSRWVARFSGLWTHKLSCISTRQRDPEWTRNLVCRSRTAAIRGSVQRSLVKPWACAPPARNLPKATRWDCWTLGGCPNGRRFQACLPLASRARRHRSAVGVETSHCRVTSAWVTPRANNAMPIFRRTSMASRLRFVGRGFRMSDFVTPPRQHFPCYS